MEQRLPLVLDLDHTLLHSVIKEELCQKNPLFETIVNVQSEDLVYMVYGLTVCKTHLWTKLRPGVQKFLSEASCLFDLYVCTMGTKEYAEQICKLLDPSGKLFSGRIMSREDYLGKNSKPRLKDVNSFTNPLFQEGLFAIVDDTPSVWSSEYQKKNLVQIQRYEYFPMRNPDGSSLFECWDDEDGSILMDMLKLLQDIHKDYIKSFMVTPVT